MQGARRIVQGKTRGNRRALVAETQARSSMLSKSAANFRTWCSRDLSVRISSNPVRCSCRQISRARTRPEESARGSRTRIFRWQFDDIELRRSETERESRRRHGDWKREKTKSNQRDLGRPSRTRPIQLATQV